MLNFSAIEKAAIKNKPYPFAYVPNALDEQYDAGVLEKEFPAISQGGSFPRTQLTLGASLEALIAQLEGERFKRFLERAFSLKLDNKPIVTTFRGYSRLQDGKIHTDSASKIVTVLFYLNSVWDQEAGRLRILNGADDLEDYVQEISPVMGSMLAFKVTGNDWHGYVPMQGIRRSIQLNYIHSGSAWTHQLRHNWSALAKRCSISGLLELLKGK